MRFDLPPLYVISLLHKSPLLLHISPYIMIHYVTRSTRFSLTCLPLIYLHYIGISDKFEDVLKDISNNYLSNITCTVQAQLHNSTCTIATSVKSTYRDHVCQELETLTELTQL